MYAGKVRRFFAVATGTLSFLLLGMTGAHAATTTTILYSIDGGATWDANPTIPGGSTVLTRIWYDNSDPAAAPTTSITSTLPAGFSLVPGSTSTCLNPSTTNPLTPSNAELVCNTSGGQGGAINEGAVWTGSNLTVGPTAGIFGQSTGATSSTLAMGKKRFFTLNQCNYNLDGGGGAANPTGATGPVTFFNSGTTASNTASSPTCGGSSPGFTLVPSQSASRSMDLLGLRYVNLQQCPYVTTSPVGEYTDLVPGVATNSSNSLVVPACPGSSAGYTLDNAHVETQPLDLLNNRYINLETCYYRVSNGTMLNLVTAGGGTGTNASNTAGTAPCPGTSPGFQLDPNNSNIATVDTLDPARGRGFVQYSMVAPTPPVTVTEPQTATMVGLAAPAVTNGSLTILAPDGTPMIDPLVGGVAIVVAAGVVTVLRIRRGRLALDLS